MRRYNEEFREQALKLSDEIGVKKAAEQLGIIYGTLMDWRKSRNRKKEGSAEPEILPLTERERHMLKEIHELKEANEILKDALGFFVKDRKK
ncbi:transposase [Sediminispirochaeta smaragdinae]|uniref:Transposase IS3/IS911 family protein n=2 Tax=Sediminispirochaeta TaxID=1911556 RepID=E1R7N4_SEDSS|nr:transposase [Sediminispirochaeta smaragdinae]ADK82739.1 transposase IS3/IS911 family protein [Sediminispirochaeta smaragdinae DSM 11293]ADK83036.1 transposase IS3/IS911 family protein [Sediminispirochaeta smaragdinae DSM 11293]